MKDFLNQNKIKNPTENRYRRFIKSPSMDIHEPFKKLLEVPNPWKPDTLFEKWRRD
jgi:hypothetical protein